MDILYSPSSHVDGVCSGFYFSIDTKVPKNAFIVSSEDHMRAINLSDGMTYSFKKPGANDTYGKLIVSAAPSDFLLNQAKLLQKETIQRAYAQEVTADIFYKSLGGVEKTYQTNGNSVNNLNCFLIALEPDPGALPKDFCWISADNTPVPFVYEDIQKLAQLIINRSIISFAKLQDKKKSISNSLRVEEVQSITW